MTLNEAVSRLDSWNEESTLFVRGPWTPLAECVLAELDDGLGIPQEVTLAGSDYFLDVHVAREVLGVFGEKPTPLDRKVRLLLFYAEHDAFPDWAYQR